MHFQFLINQIQIQIQIQIQLQIQIQIQIQIHRHTLVPIFARSPARRYSKQKKTKEMAVLLNKDAIITINNMHNIRHQTKQPKR